MSGGNVQKLPLGRTLEQFAQRKWASMYELTGKSLPASVAKVVSSGIVAVKFELANVVFTLPQITVPIMGSEYVRLPIQVGMKGWVIPANVYLGGVSGLGGGTADLSPRPNLANLVFSPIGNSGWDATEDPNALVLYGPDGTIVRSTDKSAILKVTKTENSWTAPGSAPATIKGPLVVQGDLRISGNIVAEDGSVYTGNLRTSGDIIAGSGTGDQIGLRSHTHGGVQTGGGNTGAPNAGT